MERIGVSLKQVLANFRPPVELIMGRNAWDILCVIVWWDEEVILDQQLLNLSASLKNKLKAV